jgi:hypothetical protein
MITWLASVAVVPSADSIFNTTAVLETEIMAPNQIACVIGIPRPFTAASATAAHVTTI